MQVPLVLDHVKLSDVSGVIAPTSPYYPPLWTGGGVWVPEINRIAYSTGTQWIIVPGPGDYVPANMAFTLVPKENVQSQDTIVLTNDDRLFFPVEANKAYAWRGTVIISTVASSDFQFSFNGPASPVGVRYSYQAQGIPGGTNPYIGMVSAFNGVSPGHQLLSATATFYLLSFDGVLFNGPNAGVVNFMWASVTAGTLISVQFGSYLEYRKFN